MSQSILVHILVAVCNVSQKKNLCLDHIRPPRAVHQGALWGILGSMRGQSGLKSSLAPDSPTLPPYCYIVPSLFATRLLLQTHCGNIFFLHQTMHVIFQKNVAGAEVFPHICKDTFCLTSRKFHFSSTGSTCMLLLLHSGAIQKRNCSLCFHFKRTGTHLQANKLISMQM